MQAWQTNPNSLPVALNHYSAVVYNGYIYTLGGGTNNVYYAPINSNGTIGVWKTNPNNMPASLIYNTAAVAYNGYIYSIGGEDNGVGVNTSSVFYAQINASSTGTWYKNPNSLPTALEYNSAVVWNGYIYNLGGTANTGNGNGGTTTVLYAQINTSSTGAWTTNPNSLPSGLAAFAAAAYNGYVYVIGGYVNGSGLASTVYYAPINSDHTLGAFQTNSNSLPSALDFLSAIAYNGYLYVIGGETGSGATSSVFYAAINSTGSVGVWQNAASLPDSNEQSFAVVSNGYAYLVGGSNGTNNTSSVFYVSLDNRPIYWGATAPLRSAAGNYQSTVTYTAVWSQ